MKNWLILAAMGIILCTSANIAKAEDANILSGRTLLQIESEGRVEVEPDFMAVSAGIVTTGQTAAEALDKTTNWPRN